MSAMQSRNLMLAGTSVLSTLLGMRREISGEIALSFRRSRSQYGAGGRRCSGRPQSLNRNISERITKLDTHGALEQSSAQESLWYLRRLHPLTALYHMSLAMRPRRGLQLEALNTALHALEHRHEIFRTTFQDQ